MHLECGCSDQLNGVSTYKKFAGFLSSFFHLGLKHFLRAHVAADVLLLHVAADEHIDVAADVHLMWLLPMCAAGMAADAIQQQTATACRCAAVASTCVQSCTGLE